MNAETSSDVSPQRDFTSGIRLPPARSGDISGSFLRKLHKYGASARLQRKLKHVTSDSVHDPVYAPIPGDRTSVSADSAEADLTPRSTGHIRESIIPKRDAVRGSLLHEQVTAGADTAAFRTSVWLREQAGDPSGADALATEAADRGDIHALTSLARWREHAAGDPAAAEALYRQAAERGASVAMTDLAVLLQGQGNHAEAEHWFRRAAAAAADAGARGRETLVDLHNYVLFGDLTYGKLTDDELNEHTVEVERRNEGLREANSRLTSALVFKNELISMLTHDVAQPISSIASLAELLHADWVDLPDDIRLELVSKIDKNMHRLITMMNDVQLLFRLDIGAVNARRAPVKIREVVTAVIAELRCESDVTVAVDEDVSVLADRPHLWHVVLNLMTNALSYGKPPVEVHATRVEGTVVLVVQDHGSGIPDELLPNLFERFMRGAGLGLFIVRHLVEANGGSIRYEAARPTGARMIITLEAS